MPRLFPTMTSKLALRLCEWVTTQNRVWSPIRPAGSLLLLTPLLLLDSCWLSDILVKLRFARPYALMLKLHLAMTEFSCLARNRPSNCLNYLISPVFCFLSTIAPKSPPEKTRYDTSLGLLTKKFVDLLAQSSDGVLDLNLAAETLQVNWGRCFVFGQRFSDWWVTPLNLYVCSSLAGTEKAVVWYHQCTRRHSPHQEEIQEQHSVDVSGYYPSLCRAGAWFGLQHLCFFLDLSWCRMRIPNSADTRFTWIILVVRSLISS